MAFVPGICPQCGGQLDIDNSQEAAICKFCGTPFIVEKAINNYNVNLNNSTLNIENAVITSGPTADNLAKRGARFEQENNYELAEEYYNKALDIDVDCSAAIEGIERINQIKLNEKATLILNKGIDLESVNRHDAALEKYLEAQSIIGERSDINERIMNIKNYLAKKFYFESSFKSKNATGALQLTKFQLICKCNMKGDKLYNLTDISNLSAVEDYGFSSECFGRKTHNCIRFKHGNEVVTIKVHRADELVECMRELGVQ